MKIELIISILTTISGIFFRKDILYFFRTLRKEKLAEIIEINQNEGFINNFDENFKEKFIIPNMKERYFHLETGIKTNEKSILKYIEFKNSIEKNYTWENIKVIVPHLEIKEDKIEIKLSKLERFVSKFNSITAFVILILGFLSFIYFTQNEITNFKSISILFIVTVIFPIIFGYFILNSIDSIIVARNIEKYLKSISTENKKDNK